MPIKPFLKYCKLLCITSLLVMQTSLLRAQTSESPFMAELSAIFLDYRGPYTGNYVQYKDFDPGIVMSAHAYLNKMLNISLNSAFLPEADWLTDQGEFFTSSLIDVNALMQIKTNGTVFAEDALVAPYIGTGFGLNSASNNIRLYVPATLGFRFQVSKNFSLHLAGTYKFKIKPEGYQPLTYTAGFVFALPSNKRPVTSPTPFDPDDEDPPIANNPVRLADRDNDGVPDRDDLCPDVKGKAMYLGCPENEKEEEGIAQTPPQGQDQTRPQVNPKPETPKEDFGYTGNIDELNKVDRVNKSLQKDGIFEADNQFINMAMNNIYFEPASDELTYESLAYLDTVSMILLRNPGYNLQVLGHTDDSGSHQENIILSIKRAFKVKYYLVNQKDVKMSRISSDGYSSAAPLSNNDSENGRAMNRRVEFKLVKNTGNDMFRD